MAFDSDRHVMVLFGGITPSGLSQYGDTWEYDGVNWSQSAASGPNSRHAHAMAYDPIRHRTVLFGGLDGSTRLGDTWEYDGSAWSLRHPTSSSQERFDLAMAFDPVRNQVIRFGGSDGSETGDTLAWDGAQWTLLPVAGPPARIQHAMATDTVRNQIVLFGGFGRSGSSSIPLQDTWLWDGVSWQPALPALVPPTRYYHAMAFDSATAKTIMFGGDTPSGADRNTWAWDGNNWSLPGIATRPPASDQPPLAYDFVRDRLVLFTNTGETWEYHAPVTQAAGWSVFGSGCPGSGGVPALSSLPGSLPFTGAPFRLHVGQLGQHPFLLPFGIVGYSDTTWAGHALPLDLGLFGFPGCTAYTEAFAYVSLSLAGDHADWTIAIPPWSQLAGSEFWAQCFVLDGGAPAGAAVSNAGHGQIGLR
jgi:hypothetical protein